MQMGRERVSRRYGNQTWCQSTMRCFQKSKTHSRRSSKKYLSQSVGKAKKNRVLIWGTWPGGGVGRGGSKNSENGIWQFGYDLVWRVNNPKPNHPWLKQERGTMLRRGRDGAFLFFIFKWQRLGTDVQVTTDVRYGQGKAHTWKLTVITRAEATVTAKDW